MAEVMIEIRKNDIVQLKSGGPKMTVQRFIGDKTPNYGIKIADEAKKLRGFDDGDVVCQWFDGNDLKEGTFPVNNLKRVEDI